MHNRSLNAKFSRIIRMIEEIREFALDGTFDEDIAEGNIETHETLESAIGMLGDDIHDCSHDDFESADNPHSMTETEFDAFLTLLETMHPKEI